MFGATKTAVLLWLLGFYRSSVHAVDVKQHQTENRLTPSHSDLNVAVGSKETGSDGTSGTVVTADGTNCKTMKSVRNAFQNLMSSSVDIVHRSINTFQGLPSSVFKEARARFGQPKVLAEMKERTITGLKKRVNNVKGVGKSVAKIFNVGVAGVKEAADLGGMLGDMGKSVIQSKFDGADGTERIFKILIKYVALKVGESTKNTFGQFKDGLCALSAFVADDDDVTGSISIIMKKIVEHPDISVAVIRTTIAVMEGSPATSCVLDQLPLTAAELRALFNAFVGSDGQPVEKTLADVFGNATTDFQDVVQSLTTSTSFASNSDTPAKLAAERPTSTGGTLASFFTGDGEKKDEDVPASSIIDKNKTRNGGNTIETGSGQNKPIEKQNPSQEDGSWIDNGDGSTETVTKSLQKTLGLARREGDSIAGTHKESKAIGNDNDVNDITGQKISINQLTLSREHNREFGNEDVSAGTLPESFPRKPKDAMKPIPVQPQDDFSPAETVPTQKTYQSNASVRNPQQQNRKHQSGDVFVDGAEKTETEDINLNDSETGSTTGISNMVSV